MPDPIYKTKDGQQVSKQQLLNSGYSEERILKGLANGVLVEISAAPQQNVFKTKDGQQVTYEQLKNSGYSDERIKAGQENGILSGEKKNLSASGSNGQSYGTSDTAQEQSAPTISPSASQVRDPYKGFFGVDMSSTNQRVLGDYEALTEHKQFDLGEPIAAPKGSLRGLLGADFHKKRVETNIQKRVGQYDKELNKANVVAQKVHYGILENDGSDLIEASKNPYTQAIVRNMVLDYEPEVANDLLNPQSAAKAVFAINSKNRKNAVDEQAAILNQFDGEISQGIAGLAEQLPQGGFDDLTRQTVDLKNTLQTPDLSDNKSISEAISKLKEIQVNEKIRYMGAPQAWKQSFDKTESIINKLSERISINTKSNSENIAWLNPKIERAVVSHILNDNQPDPSTDYARIDQFKLGLSALEYSNPNKFKLVTQSLAQKEKIASSDYSQISQIGQSIHNRNMFQSGAISPSFIGRETDFDYTTSEEKTALAAGQIGEYFKAAGIKNRRRFTENEILKAGKALGVDDKIAKKLALQEALPLYDAIPKSGVADDFVRGLQEPIVGMLSSMEGLSETPYETYLRSQQLGGTSTAQKVPQKQGGYGDVLASEEDSMSRKMVQGLAQFVTQAGSAKIVGGVLGGVSKLAGAGANTVGAISVYGGTAVPIYVQSYGPAYEQYLQETGNPDKAGFMAHIDAGLETFSEMLLPDVQIADMAIQGFKRGAVSQIVKLIEKGGDPASLIKTTSNAKNVAADFFKKTATFGKQAGNVAGQEISEELFSLWGGYVSQMAFDPNTAIKRDMNDETWDTIKETALSMALPSILGAAGNVSRRGFTTNVLHDAAINMVSTIDGLDRKLNNGEITQDSYNSAVKMVNTHSESIALAPEYDANGQKLLPKDKLSYAFESTKSKVYKEKIKEAQTVDDTTQEQMWGVKLAETQKIQESILNPKQKKQEDTALSEPIEGLDGQGIPIGDNVPAATDGSVPLADSENQPENITQPVELNLNPKPTNEPIIQEGENTIPSTPESTTDQTANRNIEQTEEAEGKGVAEKQQQQTESQPKKKLSGREKLLSLVSKENEGAAGTANENALIHVPDEASGGKTDTAEPATNATKKRNRILQNHLLDNDGDIDGAFGAAGYVDVNGIWVAPEAAEYAKKVSPKVWQQLKDKGIKYLEGGDDGRGLQKTISYDNKNIRGIGVNENVGDGHSGHDHTMLHETAHHVWQEELTPEQKAVFGDDNPVSDYAKSVKEGKEKTLAKHDEEDFAELYAKNNGDIDAAIAEKMKGVRRSQETATTGVQQSTDRVERGTAETAPTVLNEDALIQSAIDNADKVNNTIYRDMLKDGDKETVEGILKEVSDQWHDTGTRQPTENKFGKEVVEAAVKLFPKEDTGTLSVPEQAESKPNKKYSIVKHEPMGGGEEIEFVKVGNPYIDPDVTKNNEAATGLPISELSDPSAINQRLSDLYYDRDLDKDSGMDLSDLDEAISFLEQFVNKGKPTISKEQQSIVNSNSEVEANKADIERRRQEELKKFGTGEKRTSKNNVKVLGVNEYVSKELMELAYSNDDGNNPEIGGGGQPLSRIIERGGYSKAELLQLLKPEIDKINAKYNAELAALENKPTISKEQPQTKQDAIQIESADESLLRNKGIRGESGLQDVVKGDQEQESTPKESKKEKVSRNRKVRDEKLNKEINDALGDFFKPKGGLTMGGLDPQRIEQGTKIIGLYVKAGVYKFSDIVKDAYDKYGPAVKDFFTEMKAAYSAFYSITNDETAAKMEGNIRSITYEQIEYEANINDNPKGDFVSEISDRINAGEKLSIVSIRSIAKELGLEDVRDTTLQEYVELAIINNAKDIRNNPDLTQDQKLEQVVALYNAQPTISMRSNDRIENQQYSTPIPLAFVAGEFVNAISPKSVLEPSGGNGMMVFNVNPAVVTANEIDAVRLENLEDQPFNKVMSQDGREPFSGTYDAVVTNPPFGASPAKKYGDFSISGLDEQMVINGLNSMKDNGRAAIIIGGHTSYRSNGSLGAQKAFIGYLYQNYNVADIINIDGGLYSKQGTSFPIRMILINGRRLEATQNLAPVQKDARAEVETDFNSIYERIKNINNDILQQPGTRTVISSDKGNTERDTTTQSDKATGRKKSVGGGRSRGNSRGATGTSNTPRTKRLSDRDGDGKSTSDISSKPVERGGDIDSESGVQGTLQGSNLDGLPDVAKRDLEKEKMPYIPASKAPQIGSVMPANMTDAMRNVLSSFKDIDQFVVDKLGYKNKEDLYGVLSAEQIDGVGMAIHQIENGGALIIGDMTGVGKGRQAAAVLRYAVRSGRKPIFLTEKAGLFSDMWRDLNDIGSGDLVPLIINSSSEMSNSDISDATGKVLFKNPKKDIKGIISSQGVPEAYDWVAMTYSQLNNEKLTPKQEFFNSISKDNILIMDESHNASGQSNTGKLIMGALPESKGVVFLSATFAKNPSSMPIYALKTDMGGDVGNLITAITSGGVPMQEIMSGYLVQAGQMVRRERDFTGVTVDWESMEAEKAEHTKTFDAVTEIFNDIIAFQRDYITPIVEVMDKEQAGSQGTVGIKKGTKDFGVDNQPFSSKTFNLITQLLFSLKAKKIGQEALAEIKAGRKPVIATFNTMGTFLNDYSVGDEVDIDYSRSLQRGLDGVFRISITNSLDEATHTTIPLSDLSQDGLQKYNELKNKIEKSSVGITLSPIDDIKKIITDAGYSIGEMTGRKVETRLDEDGVTRLIDREDKDKKKTARDFNNGDIDALIINRSASTGISLHASGNFKDQRQRVMIFAQSQLDVNTEVQMRGRIDRTGQVLRGAYRYITSAIPAESRLVMMFKAKLKSLDANTTSSQKSKTNEIQIVDFLNKYGDEVVVDYLKENREINDKLGDPLSLTYEEDDKKSDTVEGAARKVSGRVALLSVADQERFYNEVGERYESLIDYLNENGTNDLEVTTIPLNATFKSSDILVEGTDNNNKFTSDVVRERVEVDVLKKPMTAQEIKDEIEKVTGGDSSSYKEKSIEIIENFRDARISKETDRVKAELERKRKIVLGSKKNDEQKADSVKVLQENSERDLAHRIAILNGTNKGLINKMSAFNVGGTYAVASSGNADLAMGNVQAIFLGYRMSKNPTASNVKAVFATLDGRRRIEIPFSQQAITNIIAYRGMASLDANLGNWDSKKSDKTRKERFIVTGNIVAAYGVPGAKGQLISYSTDKGEVKQGILLPESYDPEKQNVRMPLHSMKTKIEQGETVVSSDNNIEVSKERWRNYFELKVPLSKKLGGQYFLDTELRDLVYDREFNQRGGKMLARVMPENLSDVLNLLSNKFKVTVDAPLDSKPNTLPNFQVENTDLNPWVDIVQSYIEDNEQGLSLKDTKQQIKNDLVENGREYTSEIDQQVEDAYNAATRNLKLTGEEGQAPFREKDEVTSKEPNVLTTDFAKRINAFVAKVFGVNGDKVQLLNGDAAMSEKAKELADKVNYMTNRNGEILGFTNPQTGEIFLNAEKLNPNTLVHEASHIYLDWLENNPEVGNNSTIFNEGLKKIRGSKYLSKIKASEFYKAEASKHGKEGSKEYNRYMEKEALAHAIGDNGAEFFMATQRRSFKEWAKQLWEAVGQYFGIKNKSAEEIRKMSLGEFSKSIAADILDPDAVFEKQQPKEKSKEKQSRTENRPIPEGAQKLRHEDTAEILSELNLNPRDYEKQSVNQWMEDAADILHEKGYEEIVQKATKGEPISTPELVALGRAIVEWKAKVEKTLANADINELHRLIRAKDMAASEAARTLVSQKVYYNPNDKSLASAIINAKEALEEGGGVLTEERKDEVVAKWGKSNALRQKIMQNQLAARKRAEDAAMLKAAKKAHEERNKNRKDIPEGERRTKIDEIKKRITDKINKMIVGKNAPKYSISYSVTGNPQQAQVKANYITNEIAADVREVSEMFGSLGFNDLVDQTFNEVKDLFQDITRQDIVDVLGGKYDETKTKKEVLRESVDFDREKKILKELAELEAEPVLNRFQRVTKVRQSWRDAAIEKKKRGRNAKIVELRKQLENLSRRTASVHRRLIQNRIAELQNELQNGGDAAVIQPQIDTQVAYLNSVETVINSGELTAKELTRSIERNKGKLKEEKAKPETAETKKEIERLELAIGMEGKELDDAKMQAETLKTRIAALKQSQSDIKDIIAKDDFKPEAEPIEVKLTKEEQAIEDELIKIENEEMLKIMKDRYNPSRYEKMADYLNIVRGSMSTFDLSGLGRQGALVLTGYPSIAAGASQFMLQAATSEKVYDRWMYALQNKHPRYNDMISVKLALSDMKNPNLNAKEESFQTNVLEKVPGYGVIYKGSERAYSGVLNKMRVDLYDHFAEKLESQGKTVENSKEEYDFIASYINTITGRGNLHPNIQKIAPILNGAFFSPRLIAARLNSLTYWGRPSFWKLAPKEIKVAYFADMLKFGAFGVVIAGLAASYAAYWQDDDDDAKVSVDFFNPTSADFMKIKIANTRVDQWAGFQQYVTFASRMFAGHTTTQAGNVMEYGEGYKADTRLTALYRIIRGKVNPVLGMGLDFIGQETFMGEKIRLESTLGRPNKYKEIGLDEYMFEHIMPMSAIGSYEAIDDLGWGKGSVVTVLNVLGFGSQTYDNTPKPKTQKKPGKQKQQKKQQTR